MSLIKCTKCGTEFDSDDKKCPNCDFENTVIPPHLLPIKPSKSILVWMVGFILFGVFLIVMSYLISLTDCFLYLVLGVCSMGAALALLGNYLGKVYEYNLSKTDPAAYLALAKEREQEKLARQEKEIARQKEELANKYNNYRYKCPMCGSNKIMNISTSKKAVSAEVWGLGSKTLGKCYQCDECKYMW